MPFAARVRTTSNQLHEVRVKKRFVFPLFLVPFAMVVAACVAEPVSDENLEFVDETEQALSGAGGWCAGNCSCKEGLSCQKEPGAYTGTCVSFMFGPPPPKPPCYGSCQCTNRKTCVFPANSSFGSCESPPASCTSDCDCGVAFVCSAGQCTSTFGPFPACRCDKHCPAGKHCTSGGCK
jgi:hypothetical protein